MNKVTIINYFQIAEYHGSAAQETTEQPYRNQSAHRTHLKFQSSFPGGANIQNGRHRLRNAAGQCDAEHTKGLMQQNAEQYVETNSDAVIDHGMLRILVPVLKLAENRFQSAWYEDQPIS